jgi:aminoglycoside phosphotransferase (APT) family kinase protein
VSGPGIDVAALRERAERALRRPGGGATGAAARLGELTPLPGGISSLTFAAPVMGPGPAGPDPAGPDPAGPDPAGPDPAGPDPIERVVVKVAPPGLAPVRNRDVLRQARLLRALKGIPGVRVPAVLGEADGDPPLFVMSFVPGTSFEPRWDATATAPDALTPALVRERALAAARMLAALQTPEASELAPALAGEPGLAPQEELERWAVLYDTVGEDLRGEAEVALRRALKASAPPPIAARVLHGDFRLGNLLFDGAELTAIIDWEIWSLGDPRCDVAWLMHFCDPVMERRGVDARLAEAMPDAEATLGAYLDAAPDALVGPIESDLGWFRALAAYKLGATMAVLAKRNRRLPDPDPSLERAAQTTPAMLQRARRDLARRRS